VYVETFSRSYFVWFVRALEFRGSVVCFFADRKEIVFGGLKLITAARAAFGGLLPDTMAFVRFSSTEGEIVAAVFLLAQLGALSYCARFAGGKILLGRIAHCTFFAQNKTPSITVKAIFFLGTVIMMTAPFHTGPSPSLCALSCIDLMRLLRALVFRILVVCFTTESVEIVRIVFELVVFIFATVRGLLPETAAFFIDAIDYAIANNEVITTLLFETQLGAFLHRACFVRSQVLAARTALCVFLAQHIAELLAVITVFFLSRVSQVVKVMV
jgi:hypothetical protein